jgi:hypothetical protein
MTISWLRSPNVLPFPIHIVSASDLRADLLAGARGRRWASIPAFTRNVTPAGTELPVYDEDENGDLVIIGSRILKTERVGVGMIRRQCTLIRPTATRSRSSQPGGRSPGGRTWIGIAFDGDSTHEAIQDWQINRWPLIEQQMTRHDCLRWLERHGQCRPARIPFPFRRSLARHARPTPMHCGGCRMAIRPWARAGIAPFMAFAGARSAR